MEKRKLTCIGCPMGCQVEVELDGSEVQTVTGNHCKRGDAYARKEVTNPTRIVTTTVRLAGGGVVPVKTKEDIPKEIGDVIGYTTGERLDHFIHDIVTTSSGIDDIRMSEPVAEAMKKLRQFMFERVYQNPEAKSEEGKAEMLMKTLYHHFLTHIDVLPADYLRMIDEGEERERVVCDYVGAMTDRFAIATYEELYIPKSWHG